MDRRSCCDGVDGRLGGLPHVMQRCEDCGHTQFLLTAEIEGALGCQAWGALDLTTHHTILLAQRPFPIGIIWSEQGECWHAHVRAKMRRAGVGRDSEACIVENGP